MSGQFFDTEALLYILSGNPAKADGEAGMISVQVLNEVANVVRRNVAMSWTERSLLAVQSITVEVHEKGPALAECYRLSIYGATIAASALLAGRDTL